MNIKNAILAGALSVSTLFGVSPSQAAINAPTGVTATALNSTSIRFTWTDNSTDESGFRIYLANNAGAAYVEVGEVPANVTEFTVTGLNASTQRFGRIVAFRDSVYVPEDISSVSAHASATTTTVPPVNTAPVAVDDAVTVVVGNPAVGNVLTNDIDTQVLTVVQPNAVIAADGSFDIPTNQVGSVQYNYTVSDGSLTDVGQLTVTVTNNLPVVQNETVTVVVGQPAIGDVLANDSDADGHLMTVTSTEFTVSPEGLFNIPTTTVGSTDYEYLVTDGFGVQVIGVLTVVATNQNPVAVDDEVTVTVGQSAQGDVLANDSDPDGHSITASSLGFTVAPDGSFSIPTTVVGSTEYDYVVSDGFGGFDVGQLTVVVNAVANTAPTAVDDTASGMTNTTPEGDVLANDTDPEGNALTVTSSTGPISINTDGTWSFPPPHAAGTYETDYVVSDGSLTDNGKLTVTITALPPAPTGLTSFPGADGAGRFAQGGRGGQVIQVTNLNDSGPGSLRACAEASGPRTCVFNKTPNGYIVVNSSIMVDDPFLTLAGETARGQGITLRASTSNLNDLMIIRTHDVIIRHLRFRGGHPPHNISSNGRNLMIGDIIGTNAVHDVMVDHSSFSWATDQPFDVSPSGTTAAQPASQVSRITIQDSLVYEGLKGHSKGPNYRACGVSTVRTMIASVTIRAPNNTCGKHNPGGLRGGGGVTGETEFVNSISYNGVEAFFDMWDGRGEGWANIVGNVFKKGPNGKARLGNTVMHSIYPVDAWTFSSRQLASGTCAQGGPGQCSPDADPLHMYLNDNIAVGFGNLVKFNPPGVTPATVPAPAIHGVLNPNDAHLVSSTPVGDGVFEDGILVDNVMPASQVQAYISANAGAFPHNRDVPDARIINDMNNGTGNIPTCTTNSAATVCDLFPVSNYTALATGPAYPDVDDDGMDDTWEAGAGVSNPNADHDNDGYTNLEEFLHFLAAIR